jgi:hypothetical protein
MNIGFKEKIEIIKERYEGAGVVLSGDFKWLIETISSQNLKHHDDPQFVHCLCILGKDSLEKDLEGAKSKIKDFEERVIPAWKKEEEDWTRYLRNAHEWIRGIISHFDHPHPKTFTIVKDDCLHKKALEILATPRG